MKIQINSLEVVERMIGGDTEVEIEVRNSIVQSFVHKHLKGLANLPALEEIKESILKDSRLTVAAEVKSQLGEVITTRFSGVSFGLADSAKDAIRAQTSTYINMEISKQVRELVNSKMDDINKTIDIYVTEDFNKKVKDSVDRKLKELAAKLS